MAATLNAFSILQGAGEQPQASSQKKKKNRSKKKGGAGSDNQAVVQDPVPEHLTEETVLSTPEPEVAVEDGFQLAGRLSRKGSTASTVPQLQGGQASAAGTGPTSSAGPLPSDQTGKPQIRTVYEGMEAVAHAAKTVSLRGDTERLQLWSSWVDQVKGRRTAHDKEIYMFNGKEVDFKKVLLTSDALEMTVGSCVSAPLAPEREERLRKMLNSVFTHPDSAVLVAPVAAGVIGLGQGLDSDAKDIVKAATETVQAIIVWLKARELGMEVSAAAQGRDRLREVATQLQQRLANKAAPMASKDAVQASEEAVALAQEQVDLLTGRSSVEKAPEPHDGQGGAGNPQAALLHLKALLEQHIVRCKGRQPSTKRDPATMRAKYYTEEDVLRQQLAHAQAEIMHKEKELAYWKQQAKDLEIKCQAALQNLHSPTADRAEANALPGQVAAFERQLSAANTLGSAFGACNEDGADLPVTLEVAIGQWARSMMQLLTSSSQYMGELKASATKYASKLAAAIKTGKELELLKLSGEAIANNKRHQKEYEKQLQEVQATAKSVYLRSQGYQSGVSTLESLVASLRADKVCPRGDLTAMRTDLARIKEDYRLIVDEVIYKGQRPPAQKQALENALSHADPVVQPKLNGQPAAIGTQTSAGGTGADALAARLATLELENQRKDAEIAALRGQSGGPGSSRPADRPETPASTATGADDIAPGESRADSPTEDVPAQSDQANRNAQASNSANGAFEEPKNRRRRGRGPRQHA